MTNALLVQEGDCLEQLPGPKQEQLLSQQLLAKLLAKLLALTSHLARLLRRDHASFTLATGQEA